MKGFHNQNLNYISSGFAVEWLMARKAAVQKAEDSILYWQIFGKAVAFNDLEDGPCPAKAVNSGKLLGRVSMST